MPANRISTYGPRRALTRRSLLVGSGAAVFFGLPPAAATGTECRPPGCRLASAQDDEYPNSGLLRIGDEIVSYTISVPQDEREGLEALGYVD